MLSNCGAGEDSWESPEINPEYSLEGLMLKLKVQYFGHLMRRADSWEKTLMLGKIEGRKRRGWTGWYGWMASPRQWTWLWANSRRYWRTGKPGVLQSMGLQRVGPDWATESENESHSVMFDSLWHCGLHAACQASLSFTISRSLLKLMSIELVMPFNHLILCCSLSSCLQSFPASGSFLMSWLFSSGGQSIGASASSSILPMNIQDWFPLGFSNIYT